MKIKEHFKAIELRKQGKSLKEISILLRVSKSTVSLWCKDVRLSQEAIEILSQKVTKGQMLSAQNKRDKTLKILDKFYSDNYRNIENLRPSQDALKIFCAIMYWCEGGKFNNSMVQFTNSDPLVIASFLKLLRQCYSIKEDKLRACLHLHCYHSESKQINYWSKITNISKEQFIKSFKKLNSGRRIRPDYQGCLQIRYYDSLISKDLLMSGKAFMAYYGSLG